MRFSAKADIRPHQCFVFPSLGAAHAKGYLDTGNELTCIDPHAYISIEAVEQCAQFIGYPTREDHATALDRVAALEAELEQCKAALDSAERVIESIDTLESADFRRRRRTGRPRKEQTDQSTEAVA